MGKPSKVKSTTKSSVHSRPAPRLKLKLRRSAPSPGVFSLRPSASIRSFATGLGIFCFTFLAAFLISSITTLPAPSHAEEGITPAAINPTGYTVDLTFSDRINLTLNTTPDGVMAVAKDTISASTNAPSGYQLYLSTAGSTNALHLDGDTANNTSTNSIPASTGTFATPAALTNNSWGYALAKDSTGTPTSNFSDNYNPQDPDHNSLWAAVPTKGNEQLIQSISGNANGATGTLDIYYGAKANMSLPAGTYSNQISYSAIIEASSISQGEATVSPASTTRLTGGEPLTITTSLQTNMDLGTVSVNVGSAACTNPTVTKGEGNVAIISCTAPANSVGTYDITVSIPKFGKSYTIANFKYNQPDVTYTVNYNANNGTGAPSATTKTIAATSTTVTLSSTKPTRSGYNFLGWAESASATSAQYQAGANITMQTSSATATTASKTLYAVWQKVYTFTLTYNANGGSGAPSSQSSGTVTTSTHQFTISSTKPTRSGYDFLGWATTSIATTASYQPNGKITVSANTTLYAVWQSSLTLNDISQMQQMSTAICNNTATGTSKTLTDTRDNNTYTVKKFNDGNCWMTQNLRLKLTSGQAVTVVNNTTGATSSWTPTNTTQTTTGTTWASNGGDVARSYDTANTSYGVYYNWYAATAGTGTASMSSGNATSSICPAGWRLPSNSGTKSYYNLITTTYGYTTGAELVSNLGFVYSGVYYYDGDVSLQGSEGNFWSSTALGSTYAYSLIFVSGRVLPQYNNSYKGRGYSVRCVSQ